MEGMLLQIHEENGSHARCILATCRGLENRQYHGPSFHVELLYRLPENDLSVLGNGLGCFTLYTLNINLLNLISYLIYE